MGACDTCKKKKRNIVDEVIAGNELVEADKNLIEVYPSVCKIRFKNLTGTGFFIKLYKNSKELFCLLTNEHVIKEKFIETKETIYIYYEIEKRYIMIKLNPKERFIECYKDMDVILIEIIKNDKIDEKYFLIPNYDNISINQEIYIYRNFQKEN